MICDGGGGVNGILHHIIIVYQISVSLKPINHAFTLKVMPEFWQFMGTEQLPLMNYNGGSIKALLPVDMQVDLDRPLTLYFPIEKLYVFDEKGERVH